MEQNEQDFQQLLQIREEIHKEIEKIPLNVLQLKEVANRFAEHFKVFESVSQNVQDQLKAKLKNASFEIAELVSEEFIKRIETQVQSILGNLDQSASETRNVLEKVSRKNLLRQISIQTLLIFLSFLIGFIFGNYYYEKRATHLSREFLRIHK